jgi:hypothetical protein
MPRFFELLNGGGSQGVRLSIAEARGILLRMGTATDLFVYELQIPLRSKDPFPFGINPADSMISIGFESVVSAQQNTRRGMGFGGPPPGDMGGFGGPGGGGPPPGDSGGPPPGMRPPGDEASSSSAAIKEWMNVRLARFPDGTH